MSKPWLDIYTGDEEQYALETSAYQETCTLLSKNAKIYGLPEEVKDLTEEHKQILQELHPSELRFVPPRPIFAGRLTFHLDSSHGLTKTRENFIALCKGDRGMCKNAPTKRLHYKGVAIHRIVKGFIAQGGDITRGDGSGGESIFGSKFSDAKEGLKNKFKRGSLGMANSGKNSNSSQFFVVLTDDTASLGKLNGKYVCFGELEESGEGDEVLEKLNEVAAQNGDEHKEKVWIGDCGVS